MIDARLHEMIAAACLGARTDEELARDLRGFLERHALPQEDIDAILAAPPRLAVYRRIVRANVYDVIERMMPRARARLNRVANGHFDETLDRFLEEAAPRTHYLRDIPGELLAWAAPRWRERTDVPRYLVDLASHEISFFLVSASPAPTARPEVVDVSIDRPLVFTEARHLARYDFAVHELPGDREDMTEPAERTTNLLAYRDEVNAVRWLELTPLAAAIVARLIEGAPLGRGIDEACAALGEARSDAVLADTARLLADLGERGVLLGAKPP
jgi:hypothetical protein